MPSSREYPERPVVGVGGVVIENGRALLIRRGGEPLRGEWSIPGGTLETGETLEEGTRRELEEETGLRVRVAGFIEVFERIFYDQEHDATRKAPGTSRIPGASSRRPRFHFVIVDYLCERLSGETRAGGDVTDVAWAFEKDLPAFQLTPTATRILKKAFQMSRRGKPPGGRGRTGTRARGKNHRRPSETERG